MLSQEAAQAKTVRHVLRKIILSWLLMLLGGVIYLLWRPTDILMFRWIQSIGLENKLIFLRDQYALEFDGNWSWVKNSLPFALWLTSSVLMFHGVWGPVKSKPAVIWSTIFIVGSVFSEFSQKCKLLPGTYDPTDLIVIFCIGVFYYLVLICSKQKKGGASHEIE